MHKTVIAIIAVLAFTFSSLACRAQGLPSGWSDADINSPPIAGTATYTTGTFTLTGSGYGIGTGTLTSDQTNYCSQPYTGNFTFIARMTSANGEGGIMLRESLSPSAREVCLFSPNSAGNAWLGWRLDTGGSSGIVAGGGAYPLWMKLVRYGDYTYKYFSVDGVNWTPDYNGEDAALTNLASTVYIGFFQDHGATGSHSDTSNFDNVSTAAYTPPVTLPGKFSTTWIGNTFGKGGDYESVQMDIDGMYVGPDGTCYANTWSLDVGRICGVYKAGACEGYLGGTYTGGASVASDGTYLYYGAQTSVTTGTVTTGEYGVWRVNASTLVSAPFSGGIGNGDLLVLGTKSGGINTVGNIWGLASNPSSQVLYASDDLTGKINLIDTANMTVSSSWQLPSGYVPYGLCWDSTDSLLWVIVQNTSSGARQIWAYNASGTQQTASTITGAVNPVSMAFYNSHLYIADNGPDQDIKVYGSLATTPAPWISYGVTGGAFSGSGSIIGTSGNWRLNGLTSIGIDSSGNIYVAYNGHGPNLNENNLYENLGPGATLESYNLGSDAQNWSIHAMEYQDCVNIDPSNESSGYGAMANYGLNWANTTPGTEWSLSGFSLNWLKYTDDYRLNSSNTGHDMTRVVRINGQPYLTLGDTYNLDFYRFNSSTDGVTAIPCAEINTSDIWTDTNGNGHRDSGETITNGGSIGYLSSADIDPSGNVYGVTSNGGNLHVIYKLICTLLSNGVPQYSTSSKVTWDYTNLSSSDTDTFTQVDELNYDSANDTMYMLGFTSTHPKQDSYSGQGTVLKSYSHWSTTPTFNWESVLPITDTGSQYTSQVIEAMANAGQYMFLQCQQNYTTLVLSKATGNVVGTMLPDPNVVGEMNPIWVDYYRGVSAFERSNGEYIVSVEDDIYNKSVVYRWTPWTDIDIGDVGATPGSSSYNPATNTYTIAGSGNGIINTTTDACHFTYLPMSGNFTLIGEVTGVTCSNEYARPGFLVRNDLTTGSEYASMLITPVGNDRLGAFFRTTEGGNTSGGSNLGTAPVWIKLVRSGSSFTEFFGSDGVNWTQYGGAITISMNSNVYVGFTASSLSTTYQATMTVSNVTLTSP